MQKEQSCNPEVWGGIECTISRIGDRYSDQLAATGHYERYSDIHRLADLGISALRYPVLWEKHQPERYGHIDWSWAARRLDALRRRNVEPIAGLLHHGSGPLYTNLRCPQFAGDLADYARRVAERFPWIEYYTPVNEPLTTARFSGLYGIWYPHRRDARECMLMLLNQIKATVLAMKAIRSVNPAAKLIQTEDLAKIHSSPELQYQAEFENHRRWLTFDLLGGKVDKGHPLWDYLLFIGIGEAELDFFVQNPCIPDIMGLNYYVTSERFLDADTSSYPPERHGGNGKHSYVDTEAVRLIRPAGLFALLSEAWHRYEWPMAVTEAHLNCTREDQLRWMKQIWDDCCIAKREGMDIRAVTAWALLGACDWDSLLTAADGHYESGAFDVSETVPRMTALGRLIRGLTADTGYDHPLLNGPGWWQRHLPGQVLGDSGLYLIGEKEECRAVIQLCSDRGISHRLLASSPADAMDCLDGERLHYRPWGIISLSVNAIGRKALALHCRRLGIAYLEMDARSKQVEGQIGRQLDLFIDEALAVFARHEHDRNRKQFSS
jgi:dTDP-4-dehydrorhamnose reductase